jgi:hypothetical protein
MHVNLGLENVLNLGSFCVVYINVIHLLLYV